MNGRDADNIAFGQLGFDMLDDSGTHTAGGGNYLHVGEWIALKAIGGDADVEAKDATATAGSTDHFTSDGTVPDGSTHLTLGQGDVIYGRFTEVRIDTDGVVMAYRGPAATL